MPSTMRFRLHLSGQAMFAQQRKAQELLRKTSAGEHTTRARLLAILAAAYAGFDNEAAAQSAEAAQREADCTADEVAGAWALVAAGAADLSCAAKGACRGRPSLVRVITDPAADPAAELAAASSGLQTADSEAAVGEKRPRITVLGGFAVRAANGEIARWQSRKARQLLKILVAKRGVAIGRETVMQFLWPGEPLEHLANRFSVATTVVRRSLDPTGAMQSSTYVESQDGLIRLRTEAVEIDVEEALALANLALRSAAVSGPRRQLLESAMCGFAGAAFEDEDGSVWAAELHRQVSGSFLAVAHALAELAGSEGDFLACGEAYRRILEWDPYDVRAHRGMIVALTKLESHRELRDAQVEYVRCLEMLGVRTAARP